MLFLMPSLTFFKSQEKETWDLSSLRKNFFWIVLYISDGDRFVHFFVLRLFYHSNLDSYNEELMIVHSVLFMGDASIQYSLLITKSLLLPGIEPKPTDQKFSALPT